MGNIWIFLLLNFVYCKIFCHNYFSKLPEIWKFKKVNSLHPEIIQNFKIKCFEFFSMIEKKIKYFWLDALLWIICWYSVIKNHLIIFDISTNLFHCRSMDKKAPNSKSFFIVFWYNQYEWRIIRYDKIMWYNHYIHWSFEIYIKNIFETHNSDQTLILIRNIMLWRIVKHIVSRNDLTFWIL